MSRYRLMPRLAQEAILGQHCAHARYVWNLAVEQQSWWRPGRGSVPGYCAQAAQLTEARAEFGWLASGSQMVQQQALRDFAQAMANYFAGMRIPSMTRSARGTLAQPGQNVRQKAGLNRGILTSGWGLLARRLEDKAPDRVEKVPPAYTSQRCSECGHVSADSRESQALFRCTTCGYTEHADVNAAKNTAAGHAVAARGRSPLGKRLNRELQVLAS